MDKLEQEIWKNNYVLPLFEKHKEIPTDYKYLLIEKDYSKMFGGKREAQERMRYMYNDSETFIFAFDNAVSEISKTVKKNLFKKYCEDLAWWEYNKILKSGMFWEFFPNLSGSYKEDEEAFYKFILERENNKKWLDKLLR